jgi:hypothetical protein
LGENILDTILNRNGKSGQFCLVLDLDFTLELACHIWP